MRKNPLLYSDHSETEEPEEVQTSPKPKRSIFFYFIILANSLLVVFVLGIIWFLFLKSPDLHIKELSQRFLGTTPAHTTPVQAETTPPATLQSSFSSSADNSSNTPTRQEQEEIQQVRLKQMREQEELAAERERLEKIRAELETEQAKIKAATEKQASGIADVPNNVTTPVVTPSKDYPEGKSTAGTISADKPESAVATVNFEATTEAEEEPAVVPNAASETLVPPTNTVDTQVDQIMELMKQQEQEKKAEEPLNDSRAPVNSTQQEMLTKDASPTISPRLITEQLDALIETETIKIEAGKLLKQATDEDKKIQINQKLSKLQANAV